MPDDIEIHFESDEGFEFIPEKSNGLCCWQCGGPLDGMRCWTCGILWISGLNR